MEHSKAGTVPPRRCARSCGFSAIRAESAAGAGDSCRELRLPPVASHNRRPTMAWVGSPNRRICGAPKPFVVDACVPCQAVGDRGDGDDARTCVRCRGTGSPGRILERTLCGGATPSSPVTGRRTDWKRSDSDPSEANANLVRKTCGRCGVTGLPPAGRSGNGSMTSDRGDPRWVLAGDGLQATHHRPQGPVSRPPANVTLALVTIAVRTSSATPRVGRDGR